MSGTKSKVFGAIIFVVLPTVGITLGGILMHRGRYKSPELAINGASLTQKNDTKLNHTSTLLLNVTVTSHNRIVYFELSDVQVRAYYGQGLDKAFGDVVTLLDSRWVPYRQLPNTMISQNLVFQRHEEEPLLPDLAGGLYSINVVFAFGEKAGRYNFEVTLKLKLPLSFNGSTYPTKCHQVDEHYGVRGEWKVFQTHECEIQGLAGGSGT